MAKSGELPRTRAKYRERLTALVREGKAPAEDNELLDLAEQLALGAEDLAQHTHALRRALDAQKKARDSEESLAGLLKARKIAETARLKVERERAALDEQVRQTERAVDEARSRFDDADSAERTLSELIRENPEILDVSWIPEPCRRRREAEEEEEQKRRAERHARLAAEAERSRVEQEAQRRKDDADQGPLVTI